MDSTPSLWDLMQTPSGYVRTELNVGHLAGVAELLGSGKNLYILSDQQ